MRGQLVDAAGAAAEPDIDADIAQLLRDVVWDEAKDQATHPALDNEVAHILGGPFRVDAETPANRTRFNDEESVAFAEEGTKHRSPVGVHDEKGRGERRRL